MIPSRAKKLAAIAPMAHQRLSLAHDKKNPVVFDTSDPGTGKTAVRVWAFAERRRKGGGCALVVGPKNLLKNAWLADFKKFAPDMHVVVATAENRAEAFAIDADVYVTNHDAVKWLAKINKASFWGKFSELIDDESTAYKHHASQRSRAMLKISRRKEFKRKSNLTATPNSNGICDVWHQVMLLDNGKRLGNSYFAFRNSVCAPVQVGRSAQAIQWQDKDGAEEAVFGLLSEIVIRHKFEDCVDIPATHHYEIEYELPAKQRKIYDEMEQSQLLVLYPPVAIQVANQLTTGQNRPIPTLTAINAGAVATKLLQICSGAVYDNDHKYHVLDLGRYDLVLDLVEARKHSLVFFHWKHQKDQLTKLAEARGITYCVLDGTASEAARTDMVTAYQAGAYRVMFAHPKSAAHGLTLTKGTSTIWTGPTYDLELFQQGNKRQARIGQKEKTEVVMVLAKDTIEEKVYEILTGKNARMKNLLDLFASMSPKAKTPTKAEIRVGEAMAALRDSMKEPA
jgi:SNF2 family DNA or RNA helicase